MMVSVSGGCDMVCVRVVAMGFCGRISQNRLGVSIRVYYLILPQAIVLDDAQRYAE
jgi:hypothetical protein